jgi:hypothetical protein
VLVVVEERKVILALGVLAVLEAVVMAVKQHQLTEPVELQTLVVAVAELGIRSAAMVALGLLLFVTQALK